MTTILLCLVLYGLLMFAAGLRCAVVLRARRDYEMAYVRFLRGECDLPL